jgi:hypothetical protein
MNNDLRICLMILLMKKVGPNKALQWTPIPLRSIGATELGR